MSWEEILENVLHLGWLQIPIKWQSSQTIAFLAHMRPPNFTQRRVIILTINSKYIFYTLNIVGMATQSHSLFQNLQMGPQ